MFYTLSWINMSTQYDAVSLKVFSNRFSKVANIPKGKVVKLNRIKGFSDQKQKVKSGKDVLAYVLDNERNVKKTVDMKLVRLIVEGTYALGNTHGNILINIFNPSKNSESSKVTIRLSIKGESIQTRKELNPIIKSVMEEIDSFIGEKRTDEQEYPKISGMFVSGLSLLSPKNGGKLVKGIPNASAFYRMMNVGLQKHGYAYDAISQNRTGKKIGTAYFKPMIDGKINISKTRPTINITSTGIVQFVGNTTLEFVHKMSIALIQVFNSIPSNKSNFKGEVVMPKTIVASKGCPKRNPQMSKGVCEKGMIPKVNKHKQVCCYKERLDATKAANYMRQFIKEGMNIPIAYTKYASIRMRSSSSSRQAFILRQPQPNKNGKTTFKSWSCNVTTKKSELKKMARNHELNNTGTKEELCDRITMKLKR
jgi:hypothetical protein